MHSNITRTLVLKQSCSRCNEHCQKENSESDLQLQSFIYSFIKKGSLILQTRKGTCQIINRDKIFSSYLA